MKNTTPIFPGLHIQTLRRKPRSAQHKLYDETNKGVFLTWTGMHNYFLYLTTEYVTIESKNVINEIYIKMISALIDALKEDYDRLQGMQNKRFHLY